MNGGKRAGAGRKPGSKNKRTAAIAQKAAAKGITPLEYMLKVMREPVPKGASVEEKITMMGMRFEAAKAAAPYVHPRLSTVAHTGEGGGPIDMHWTVEFVKPKR